jgi:CheY-like chemotaxis protein
MAHGLARHGLQVRPVAKSDQALAELSKTLPSLVISDVEPNGADGLRILELMRRDPRTAEIPVLLLAKGEWTRRRSEAQQLGAQDLLKKPLFVQDLAVLGRLYAGHSAAEEVFSGDLKDLRCTVLLRSLLAGGRSGQLNFDPAGGRIYFEEGRVIDAVLPPLNGERALWRMLTFDQGRYRLRFGPVHRSPSLSVDVKELQSRGFEHVHRWEDLRAAVGPTDTILEVDFRRLSSQLEEVSPAVWPLLRLFDGQRTVGQVIDAFGMDDLVGAQALIKLNTLGLLRPAGDSDAEPAPIALTEVVAAEPAPGVIALGEVIAPEARSLPETLEVLEFDPSSPALTVEEAFPEAADLGAALTAVVVEASLEAVAEAVASVAEASEPSLARQTDGAIETFFFGDSPQAETLVAAAAAAEQLVQAPADESVLPEGVALAIGLGETPAPVELHSAEEAAVQSLEIESIPTAAEARPVGDDLESSFFGTLGGEATHEALAAPAVALNRLEVATLEPAAPVAGRFPSWAVVSGLLAAAAAVALLVFPRSPAPKPQHSKAAVAVLPPGQILAPPSVTQLPPLSSAVVRGPEVSSLIQDGQRAYDARHFILAEESFRKAVQLQPMDPVALMYLGLSQYEQGKLTEAVEPLEKAQTLDPKNGRTDLLLGAVYQELGRTAVARASYNEYLRLDPRGEYANEVRTILASRRFGRL